MSCKWSLRILLGLLFITNIAAETHEGLYLRPQEPFTTAEKAKLKDYLLGNITTNERVFVREDKVRSIPGAVLASPSGKDLGLNQDYQFHWTRDAAIAMKEIVYLYSIAEADEKKRLRTYLVNYMNFEKKAQKQLSAQGKPALGQTKFNLDATISAGETRIENASPALRAISMMAIANAFMDEKDEQYTQTLREIITTDLNYIVSEWQKMNVDVWGQIRDQDLFFTKMVERKSLMDGAAFMTRVADQTLADIYASVANQITASLNKHWQPGLGYFTETVKQSFYKSGGMNTSIILGVLQGDTGNALDGFAINNDRVMSSVYYIRNIFSGLYRTNVDNHSLLLGRYPTDLYDGNQNIYGNPWIATTSALAEYYYKLANVYLKQGEIEITNVNKPFFQQLDKSVGEKEGKLLVSENAEKFFVIVNRLIEEGDKILDTLKNHGICYAEMNCLHFSEQVDRMNGKQVSAKDLTWSYASLLSAEQARFNGMKMRRIAMI